MPPKDFFADYLNWERKQAEKREQQKRDAQRGQANMLKTRVNRIETNPRKLCAVTK